MHTYWTDGSGDHAWEGRAVRVLIDADACPVTRETLEICRDRGVPAALYGNGTQNLERHVRPGDPRSSKDGKRGFWIETVTCQGGADSADFAIVEDLEPGDIVVTQDIGLAAMVLGREARAIGVRGRVYDRATIDMQLFIRHEEKKARRNGERTGGPNKFSSDDRRRFRSGLERLIAEGRRQAL
ncbi:DUF188 domain-containing protein [Olsenella sp. YH-ols2217]|uniref:UPF0178 protein QJ043_01895 n=1 Tax=Kribbibacterium absianum TaxID=3044210 RepID=A0ABT6ZIF1_9ACTN|nr:DUF188 domain-containing protein [Olsenella sp. YH-ols2217]MDJ1121347.1 DUF188 domain-containing protein [Olsenella sp. YH-ols2216]MDJ1128837.1 DUF188 domain-containing protein [Olsenella sp. YH-ols2217]